MGKKQQKIALCCVLAIGILATGLWASATKFGWFNSAITISTAPTENEIVSDMSKNLTEQLINDAIAYKNSNETNRASARATMHATADKRQKYIKILMREDPDEFLRLAVSPNIKQELLQEVDGIEAVASLEGKLEIIAQTSTVKEEHDHLDCSLDLFLVLPSGETKNLYLPESTPVTYGPNDQIKVTGYELDGAIVPNLTASPDNFAITVEAAKSAPITTPRQMAVILVNVEDTALPSSFTKENALQTIDDTNNWYMETSYDNTAFFGKLDPSKSADIFGIYRVSAPNLTTSCDNYFASWLIEAKTSAAADNFIAADYQHIMVMVNKPSSIPCGWDGRGTISGKDMMQFDTTTGIVTVHELGHNFGLAHATRLYSCKIDSQTVAFSKAADCSYYEYGDYYSAMGNSVTRGNPAPHFSAIDKFKLGWIPATNVATVTTNGTYDLYPSELPSAGTQLIRIPTPYSLVLPTGASSANGTAPFFYYLELRKPIGVESNISAIFKDDFNGVFLRTGSGITYSHSYFYQLGSLPGAEICARCATGLRPGMVFTDPQNPSMTIRVLSWTPDKATVDIKFEETEPPVCVRYNPDITISPRIGVATAGPGDTIDYTVTVTNRDNYWGCPTSTFSVAPITTGLPGFSFSPTSWSPILAPNDSSTQIFSVTAPSSITNGTYSVPFYVFNSDDTAYGSMTSSTFGIINVEATPPTIVVTGITNGGTINPSANTKIAATATHAEGISKVEIHIDNQLVARCNEPKNGICDVFVKGSNVVSGTHTLKVTATAKDTAQTAGTNNLTFNK